MLRDTRMRELVAPTKEPITPFAARVRALATSAGVSCVMVVGASGEYFAAADCVLAMDCYKPEDVTRSAHDIAARHPGGGYGGVEREAEYPSVPPRTLVAMRPGGGASGGGRGRVRAKTRAVHAVDFEGEELDLSGLEQLVEVSQTRAVVEALLLLKRRCEGGGAWRGLPLVEALARLDAELDERGMDALSGSGGAVPGNLARPRVLEIAAALNRLRCASMRQLGAST
jgi:predicted ABC-class ATPase